MPPPNHPTIFSTIDASILAIPLTDTSRGDGAENDGRQANARDDLQRVFGWQQRLDVDKLRRVENVERDACNRHRSAEDHRAPALQSLTQASHGIGSETDGTGASCLRFCHTVQAI